MKAATLKFDYAQVQELIAHTKASKLHRLTFGERYKIYGEDKCMTHQEGEEERGEPGLWLVKDEGIYVMSNGLPGLPENPEQDTTEKFYKQKAVYAEGFDPRKDEDTYDKARAAVGGDDFCDLVPLEGLEKEGEWKWLVIIVSTNRLVVFHER